MFHTKNSFHATISLFWRPACNTFAWCTATWIFLKEPSNSPILNYENPKAPRNVCSGLKISTPFTWRTCCWDCFVATKTLPYLELPQLFSATTTFKPIVFSALSAFHGRCDAKIFQERIVAAKPLDLKLPLSFQKKKHKSGKECC